MKGQVYDCECQAAAADCQEFWKAKADEFVSWSKAPAQAYSGSFGADRWFDDGELNACYNCIDRWVTIQPNKIAFIFDNNNGETLTFTYKQAQAKIFEICHALAGMRPGECITLYLSMSPTAVFCALACARLGIVHNFVFGGFSAESLRLRILDSRSKMIISQDFAFRGEKKINFLSIVSHATADLDLKILIFDSDKENGSHNSDGYIRWSSIQHSQEYVPPVNVSAEHPLFYLYTSGSTGLPKGLVHTTAGYLLYAAYTLKTAFDVRDNDVFCCTADIGWITGHSYCLYGPLMLGITSVLLEGLPTYPTHYRFFNIVDKYKITQLYTAPTTIRILKAYFNTHPLDTAKYSLASLRLLGSVGEPINAEAHQFFSQIFGNLHIVDTYFQTETGGIMIAPIPGIKEAVPECASLPIPGISAAIFEDDECAMRAAKKGELGKVFITRSWPGIARGILNDPKRFTNTYFSHSIYFTGDEGLLDANESFWIKGRADDVINVSGHRISTAEVESAACTNEIVAEAAIVAINHEIKGQTMVLFVVLKNEDPGYVQKIQNTITSRLGGFCRPSAVIACPGIPKTATGKLMRRVLRSILANHEVGDLSTCINKEVVDQIHRAVLADSSLSFQDSSGNGY